MKLLIYNTTIFNLHYINVFTSGCKYFLFYLYSKLTLGSKGNEIFIFSQEAFFFFLFLDIKHSIKLLTLLCDKIKITVIIIKHVFVCKSINSYCNVFVYYHMSLQQTLECLDMCNKIIFN